MSFWEERKKRKEEGVDLSDDYKRALDELAGFTPEEFSYDADTDPMYQQYHDKYERSARAAMEESITKANARSGGWGNSYAEVAAQQAYNTQMEGVTDIIPELHELAYGRHQTEQAQKKQALKDKVTYAKDAYDLAEAERTEALALAYIDVSNRVNEGTLTADGLDDYLTKNYDGMTAEEMAEIKAGLYEGGLIKTQSQLDEEKQKQTEAHNAEVREAQAEWGETALGLFREDWDRREILEYLRNIGLEGTVAKAVVSQAQKTYAATRDRLSAAQEKTEEEAKGPTVKTTVNGEEVEVSQAEVDEIYNYLRTVAAGYTDEDGNAVEGMDPVANRKTLEADLARAKDENGNRLYSDAGIAAAFNDFVGYVELAEEQTQENNAKIIEDAMAGISDKYYDPTQIGITIEEWGKMDLNERKNEVLELALEMVHTNELSENDAIKFYKEYIKKFGASDELSRFQVEVLEIMLEKEGPVSNERYREMLGYWDPNS